jgi:hypothetical protein
MKAARYSHEGDLTEGQLALAFRQLKRPGWPSTVEEAMHDHVKAQLIRGMARWLSRQPFNFGSKPPFTPAGAPPVPSTPSSAPARRQVPVNQAPRFDARMAAANDIAR